MHMSHRLFPTPRSFVAIRPCSFPFRARKIITLHRQYKQLHHTSNHPTIVLASSRKFSSPSSNSSATARIASERSGAITRHLSVDNSAIQSRNMSYAKTPSEFQARKIGAPNTLEYRCYIEKDGTPISPFHDVPLYANEQQTILNMVVEIPRWTNAKLEV